MTLKNPSMNFYDSDFDSRNESHTFDDTNDLLNVAFIASPSTSISYMLDDSSLNNFSGMLVYNDVKDLVKLTNQKANKLTGKRNGVELSRQEDNLKTTDEAFRKRSSSESDVKLHSMTNPRYLSKNEKYWVSPPKRNWMPRIGDLHSEDESMQFLEISEATDLPKTKEERTECIFTSTCLGELKKTSEEYDWSKIEKRCFSDTDDELENMEPKIRVPVSRFDHVYHELSTIQEVDSLIMDESFESQMNSDKCDNLFNYSYDSKNPKANNSFDIFNKDKASSNFPAYVMKVIQNEHFVKLLQEPGILEGSDLTLISTDLDSLSKISESSAKKGQCHSYYKINRFEDEESPSLISFEQHELDCMAD